MCETCVSFSFGLNASRPSPTPASTLATPTRLPLPLPTYTVGLPPSVWGGARWCRARAAGRSSGAALGSVSQVLLSSLFSRRLASTHPASPLPSLPPTCSHVRQAGEPGRRRHRGQVSRQHEQTAPPAASVPRLLAGTSETSTGPAVPLSIRACVDPSSLVRSSSCQACRPDVHHRWKVARRDHQDQPRTARNVQDVSRTREGGDGPRCMTVAHGR